MSAVTLPASAHHNATSKIVSTAPQKKVDCVPVNVFRIEYSRPPGILWSDQTTH